ncbi:AraC family transcriptional regulator [Mucilaginibacter sp. Bleaf8]|nr:AraC family transcriptional regulator [Mucilaginibacter sp. Bleaf8]
MKKYIQHEFLKVSHFNAERWEHPVHNHNHFEIIFIHRGKGKHYVSSMHYHYENSAVFLLAPCDIHHFEIEEETEFTFLKFTNVYLKGIGNIPATRRWNQDIDSLLIHTGRQHELKFNSPVEAEKAAMLINLIVKEWTDIRSEMNEALFFLIQALFAQLKRNLPVLPHTTNTKHDAKTTHLMHYIHEHINCAEFTQADHLASVFSLSKHYLGIYFKERTGTNLRDYVNRYKLHLIDNRLKYSSYSIKEISNELGFTDLSHFNKFYKKMTGVNPTMGRSRFTGALVLT